MDYSPINLEDKLSLFADHWSPKTVARMNDVDFKLVKFRGDFVWHAHEETDSECRIMLVEHAGTINTGGAGGELTAEGEEWI